ncbi:excinuclease ABC subunit UvrA [Pantoea sp. Aalb]|uniref:excinuclease ABC subunit UvrA n=1 Tax=Pantoea sp. Aalb TaxID=2576762 RepID=UPI00132B1FAF|nr:excinuclease ABC subunit UvrA [Pantoea sp. Aalb]MXP67796.1 excinuclease ABC subunit UvrA [Pantoea sp. Aalb]
MNNIELRGARTHNLKNINLIIPRNKLTVITGLSGSGKSSLAFDTIYAESQRRYIESLSTYTRQFFYLLENPDINYIKGLSPAISIKQHYSLNNLRSTVGTITEIYDYLRLLFARIGKVYCPEHNIMLSAQTLSQMVNQVLAQKQGCRLMLLAPVVKNCKGEHINTLEKIAIQGYIRVRIDGEIYSITKLPKLESQKKHTIEVVIDRFRVHKGITRRIIESLENALELSGGIAIIINIDNLKINELIFSANFTCPVCDYNFNKLEPSLFSFNNPIGACSTCNGLGIEKYFDVNLILVNSKLSLADGAIIGWSRHNIYYFKILCSLAEHLNFDIKAPFNTLNHKIRNIILYGSNTEDIAFKYVNKQGDTFIRYHPFEGILNNIKRRYQETKSNTIRNALSKFITNRSCKSCEGTRLCTQARHVFIKNINLPTISEMNISDILTFFYNLHLNGQDAKIAQKILKDIINRLNFLINLGLNYLSLSRSTDTLSSGEAQRIRIVSQISSGLIGIIYIIDEPSIGLHQLDNKRLISTLMELRNLGNTLIVVEHDMNTIHAADHIIDMGPGAGIHGGEVVAEGKISSIIAQKRSITGQYLSGKRKIEIPKNRVKCNLSKVLKLTGANRNNLKNITLILPIGLFTCITGVSGSGKSTLINDTLFPIAQSYLNNTTNNAVASYSDISGLENFDKVINITHNPIGRTPRSNLATYTGIFTSIRNLFAILPEARARGYNASRFSFNLRGGRCESCQGEGLIQVEMHFLPDIYVPCDQCNGKRYNQEILDIKYKGKNIHEVLDMTIEELYIFFKTIPILAHKLQKLINVGLSYIRLGQSVITLSKGEAQRIKLARELSKHSTGRTLYILDEPTTGLHFADIQQLLNILYYLRDKGNTIVVIEHNLDVIKTADWIIDLGPEGGNSGGEIIITGQPEIVAEYSKSHTASFLKLILTKTL